MAKTSRRRASSFFDSSSMKRLTGFFGGSSSEKVRDGTQTPPPPLPPLITNLSHQKTDSVNKTPTTALNGTPITALSETPTASHGASIPYASQEPTRSTPDLIIPKRVQSLTPPIGEVLPPPQAIGSLSPYLHPESPVTSARTSHRNFSGASAMSAMSAVSGVSGASYTSYASSRPTSSRPTSSRPASSQAHVPMPPSPTTADMPRQLRKKRRGGIFGRKRKDDVEIPAAWRLTHGSNEHLEGYNFAPLMRGGQVPDLWDPNGDTLVFLAPKNSSDPKSATPAFRISAGPLLFSSLGRYIEDLQFSEQANPEGSAASHDLYLEVPTGVPSARTAPVRLNFSRPGTAPTSSSANDTFSTQPGILDQLAQQEQNEASYMDEGVAYKIYYPALELEPKNAAPTKKKHKHSNSDSSDDSFQRLIDVRNLFAFLSFTFLVSTLHRETPFSILEKIFKQLQGPNSPELHPEDHSPLDHNVSARIDAAEANFLYYVDELKIDDIRNDDDAIIEALIMGERWKCQRLYREGFVHASGRWEDIKQHPGLLYVSRVTKDRLERASINLQQIRLYNVGIRLTNFDYPSVWVGDGRNSQFRPWKIGFEAMRKFTLNYYKFVYGSWPPKAGKHGKGGGYTETGGLNRMVLRRLYEDFCALYDLLVDREWIHGDRIRFEANYTSEGEEGNEQRSKEELARTTMRKIMLDFDQSYVPVQPGIPFDQPRLPYIPPTPPSTADGTKKKKKSSKPRSQKKLKSDEVIAILKNSYNTDALERQPPNQFVAAYEKLEQDFAHGKNLDDIIEARRGRWIFIYCVMQSLPMTVVDAVGCQYGDGVEYFLCENLKGSLPWERSINQRASRLSGIWGVTGPYGSLAAAGSSSNLAGDDEVDFTYRRSHCWDIAEDWRMVRGALQGEADAYELDGESGGEEFIEYRPLDEPLADSPKEMSPDHPIGLSPPPFRQSYPISERSQSGSPEGNAGGYIPYHQPGLPPAQPQESSNSDSREYHRESYHPGNYHPGAYPESDRPSSYQSQHHESSGIQELPPFEFQLQNTEDTLRDPENPAELAIPMSPTHTEAGSTSIEAQMERAFSSPTSTDSDNNNVLRE